MLGSGKASSFVSPSLSFSICIMGPTYAAGCREDQMKKYDGGAVRVGGSQAQGLPGPGKARAHRGRVCRLQAGWAQQRARVMTWVK